MVILLPYSSLAWLAKSCLSTSFNELNLFFRWASGILPESNLIFLYSSFYNCYILWIPIFSWMNLRLMSLCLIFVLSPERNLILWSLIAVLKFYSLSSYILVSHTSHSNHNIFKISTLNKINSFTRSNVQQQSTIQQSHHHQPIDTKSTATFPAQLLLTLLTPMKMAQWTSLISLIQRRELLVELLESTKRLEQLHQESR